MQRDSGGKEPLKILVPLDGSEVGDRALAYVAMLASSLKVEVKLLRCFELPATIYALPELGPYADQLTEVELAAAAEASLRSKIRMLPELGCEISAECVDPATGIIEQAQAVDLVVMSSHGHGAVARWLMGSVSTKVARGCTQPVLIVKGQTPEPFKLDTIMVCLDGTPGAERGISEALRFAPAFASRVILYRFVALAYRGVSGETETSDALEYLERLEAAHPGQIALKIVRETDGRPLIVETAREQNVDLVVLGRRSAGAFSRWLMGSVAEQVLHHADCPVLVVH